MRQGLLVLPLLILAACQAPGLPPRLLPTNMRIQTNDGELPFTAKIVDDEAERLARQWAPGAAPTHILCSNITSEGVPHAASGSWTFSFIDTRQRDKGLQIVLRPGLKPMLRRISADKLPMREPLEIRAWGIDSPKAIIKGRQYFGDVSLKRFELTSIGKRLLWSFGPKQYIEAIDGTQYTPDPTRH